MTKTRKDVWKLTDDTLDWYGRAVAAMQARPVTDPLSWRYQAAIHDYTPGRDPLAVDGEALPSKADQKTFWRQCQHGSWFFLPWHRMYLFHFEAIVTAEVVRLGGPADWALPYWNYSDSDDERLLPTAFRSAKLADGSDNRLYVAERAPGCNDGKQFADTRDTDIGQCLKESRFQGGSDGGTAGFGGPVTKFEHGGGVTGLVEATPHGSMHVAIGGGGGWMSAFNTAPLDPIFWLHHSNIDRLWAVWLSIPDDLNPTITQWLSSVSFKFHDASGTIVTMTPSQVLTTTALSYGYDNTSDPFAPARLATAALTASRAPMPSKQPEMLGATSAEFGLTDVPTHAAFDVHPAVAVPTHAAATSALAPARHRVYVNVENVTGNAIAPPFDVYVNIPVGTDPKTQNHLFVGRMPMFGLVEASQPSPTHPGSGLHYAFEITEKYHHLAAQPGWDPSKIRFSFVPVKTPVKSAVRVGRVSLYVE